MGTNEEIKRIDINEEVAAQNKICRFAVFSGGGAKGGLYSGVYQEMHTSGKVENIEVVAGSSAGAITASLIAAGVSPEKFKEVAGETNFIKLFGGGGVIKAIAKVVFGGFDGKEFENLMRETMYESISEYVNVKKPDIVERSKKILEDVTNQIEQKNLNGNQNDLFSLLDRQKKLKKLLENDAKILENFKEKITSNNEESRKITFRDLDYLNTINPKRFKGLLLTTTEMRENKLELFSIDENPDTEIAIACHASAAHPLAFKPVEIDGKKYVDGGVSNNIPQEYFEKYDLSINDKESESGSIGNKESRSKSIKDNVMVYCFKGSNVDISLWSMKNIPGPGMIMRLLTNFILKYKGINNPNKYHDYEANTHENLRKNSLNVIPLDSGNITTFSFGDASEKSEHMYNSGIIQVRRAFQNYDTSKEDPTLHLKELALQSYNHYTNNDNSYGMFTQKFSSPPSDDLLEFCTDAKWQDRDAKEVLKDMIAEFSKGTKTRMFNENSTGIKSLIKTLNDRTTENKTKKAMMDVLNLDVKSLSTYDRTKTDDKNLADMKFEQKDFIPILQEKTRDQRREKNLVQGDILKKGKSKSNVEAVLKSQSEAKEQKNSK